MANNVSISPCSVRILLDLGNWTPSIPFPFENPDGRNHVNIAKGHEVFLRCHVYTVLYRNRKRFFKPSETPLFPTVSVGLTGFEPATFCFRGAFLCWIKWLLLGPISLENGGFWFLVVFVEPAGIDPP
ncbi:hypothetical protein ACJ4Z0_00670 [Bifidobacterium catenulatum]|uniref:hypothetical protein n=1 Tax=Bifidobacterium catenulatum TaxID=1686 RepID=UPI003D33E29D